MKDYYLILNIEPNATTEEIKKSYKMMSLKYHPDKNQGDKYFEERFKDIGEAYAILSDHDKRKQYDYDVLNGYRNASSKRSTSNQAHSSGQDSSYARGEEALRQKEQRLDEFAKELEAKSKELANMYQALQQEKGSTTNNPNYFKGGVLIFGVLCCILFYLMTKKENEIVKLNSSITDLNAQIVTEKRFGSVVQRQTIADLQEQLLKLKKQPKWVPPKHDVIVNETQSTNVEEPAIVKLANRVVIRRSEFSKYATLSNLYWEQVYGESYDQYLTTLSIYNKGISPIKSITISYDINDKYGKAVNSGEFVASGDVIESSKAKIVDVYILSSPRKKFTDVVIMTITKIEYAN